MLTIWLNLNNGCIFKILCSRITCPFTSLNVFAHTNHWVSTRVSVSLTWVCELWWRVCHLLRKRGWCFCFQFLLIERLVLLRFPKRVSKTRLLWCRNVTRNILFPSCIRPIILEFKLTTLFWLWMITCVYRHVNDLALFSIVFFITNNIGFDLLCLASLRFLCRSCRNAAESDYLDSHWVDHVHRRTIEFAFFNHSSLWESVIIPGLL